MRPHVSPNGKIVVARVPDVDFLIHKTDPRIAQAMNAARILECDPKDLAVEETWFVYEKDGKGGTRWVPEAKSMGEAMRIGQNRALELRFSRKPLPSTSPVAVSIPVTEGL